MTEMNNLVQVLNEEQDVINTFDDFDLTLFDALVEAGAITKTQRSKLKTDKNLFESNEILAEQQARGRAPAVKLVNPTASQVTVTPDGVTITAEQFRQVWTDYDTYPDDAFRIFVALGFPRDGAVLGQLKPDTMRRKLGQGTSDSESLVHWYNANNQEKLVYFGSRRKAYSKAFRSHDEDDGEMYQPGQDQIHPGSRMKRNSRGVRALNDQAILAGEFYNSRTQIPPRRWSHWIKFWDRRLNNVQPNRRSLLGSLIGMTWSKTFILGYRVDRNSIYEIWYNSMDSSFSVYDRNGVELGGSLPTLSEAIKNLVHVISQQSPKDAEIFAAGGVFNQVAGSMQRVLSNDLDTAVGTIRREQDLIRKEIERQEKGAKSGRQENRARRNARVGFARAIQSVKARLPGDRGTLRRNAQKGLARYQKMKQRLERGLSDVRKEDSSNYYAINELTAQLNEVNKKIKTVQHIIDQIDGGKVEVDENGMPIESAFVEMTREFSIRSLESFNKVVDASIKKAKEAAAGAGSVATDEFNRLKKEQEQALKLRNAQAERAKEREEKLKDRREQQADYVRQGGDGMESIAKIKFELDVGRQAMQIALDNSRAEDREEFVDIDPMFAGGVKAINATQADYRRLYNRIKQRVERLDREYNQKINQYEKGAREQLLKDLEAQSGENKTKTRSSNNRRRRAIGESFEDILNNEEHHEEEHHIDLNTRQMDREINRVRRDAENSHYTAALITQGALDSITHYDETKIPRNYRGEVAGFGATRFHRGRSAKIADVRAGFWDRMMRAFRGQQYRADFIAGYSLGGKVNLEMWYITEIDPNNRRQYISSFLVYDVTARKVIQKYIPYYRNAVQIIAAKIRAF